MENTRDKILSVVLVVFAWLVALSLLYIVILKLRFIVHK
jgi:hypothetical protein